MKAQALFEAGRLEEAIAALGAELRDDPSDTRRRTFLFELLSFAGDYDRAEKQLDILADSGGDAELGVWSYRAALMAERTRAEMFDGDLALSGPTPVAGTLNGRPFESLTDADPRIRGRLEVFSAGQYSWIPLRHVARVTAEAPTRIRDVLWIPATVELRDKERQDDLGEVMLPGVAALTFRHPDPEVRLGRAADWVEIGDDYVAPAGPKLLAVDDELVPLLDLRELVVEAAADSTADDGAPGAG